MPTYLFHVTIANRLPGIAEHGLRVGRSSTFGGAYAGHSKGRIFLGDEGAVGCWWDRIRDQVEHHNEGRQIVEDSIVPVLLRVEVGDEGDVLRWNRIHDDDIGSRDCPGFSYFVSAPIGADRLEVWDGSAWLPVDDEVVPEFVAARYIASVEEERDEEETWTSVELHLPEGFRDS